MNKMRQISIISGDSDFQPIRINDTSSQSDMDKDEIKYYSNRYSNINQDPNPFENKNVFINGLEEIKEYDYK